MVQLRRSYLRRWRWGGAGRGLRSPYQLLEPAEHGDGSLPAQDSQVPTECLGILCARPLASERQSDAIKLPGTINSPKALPFLTWQIGWHGRQWPSLLAAGQIKGR